MSYREHAKALKPMIKVLEGMFGNYRDAGMFIAIICDLLQECCQGVEQRELRTIEIKINDYFSSKYDFEKDEVIKG